MTGMPKPQRLVEYLTMVAKLWGRHISGPILALVAIVAVFVNARYANDTTATATVAKYIAWITGGVSAFLVFVAQYQAWDGEREKYESEGRKLAEIEQGKPRITLKEPAAVYTEPVYHRFTNTLTGEVLREQNVPFLKVGFINDPPNSYPSANAIGVRAFIDYYRLPEDVHILRIDGRWAESDQPPVYSPLASKAHLLAANFGIGEAKSVDIAYRDGDGKCYAWNNDNYAYFNQFYVNPKHLLNGDRFRVEVRLRGNWVDKHVRVVFSLKESGFVIESYDEEGIHRGPEGN